MTTFQISPDDMLCRVYKDLGFEAGDGFLNLTTLPEQPDLKWLDQIEWIALARELDAEAIFFVRGYPVVQFFKLDANTEIEAEEKIHELHRMVWNTNRTPIFFVAIPGELRVYSAYQKPVRTLDEWRAEKRWLEHVQDITKVAEVLKEFSRPEIESEQLFQRRSKDFDRGQRVDQWLLRNLRLLRERLEKGGLAQERREYAHALIGRSIFIRYLEDRDVLVEDYFHDKEIDQNGNTYGGYIDILSDKTATYNLFHKLQRDFNGDLFPLSEEEELAVEERHLHLLQDFLKGRSLGRQIDLLFWAYDFSIIPMELVSNIYEEFYHEHGEEPEGTHYTPTVLADFVLSECLTQERLEAGARILDPACGSGIFLVQAFQRIVHYENSQRNIKGQKLLSPGEIMELLTERIVGIDVNPSAVRVAAFSLYLALLDFLEPSDIRNYTLPKLVYDPNRPEEGGKSLLCANAFSLTRTERDDLEKRIAQRKRYKGQTRDLRMVERPVLPLEDSEFDLIVGNPPWGLAREQNLVAVEWCETFNHPVGGKELSQYFIWRAQRLLKPDGEIGMLVPTGVLFKYHRKSRDFRRLWLTRNRIRAVFNFAHVRHVFFRGQLKEATAPFVAVFFAPADQESALRNRVYYISAKRSALAERLQAVVIDKVDLHKVAQAQLRENDWLWKTLMWGNLNDVMLIEELKSSYISLGDRATCYGRGYEDGGGGKYSTQDLGVDRELPTDSFYDNADISTLLIPVEHRQIRRCGDPQNYKGPRLLIKRGISQSGSEIGEIQARLTNTPFTFRDSIIGFCLDSLSAEEQKVLLGIMLSSLARYYHFLTCSTWGFWHDQVQLEEHLELPIRFPQNQALRDRIIYLVDQIASTRDSPTLFDPDSPGREMIQEQLDEAIFDLYELSDPQRDLVRDLCNVTLEFFYEGANSRADSPPAPEQLMDYLNVFLDIWNERLAPKGKELETRIYAPDNGLLVGMMFDLKGVGTANAPSLITDDIEWRYWLRRMERSLPEKRSAALYLNRQVKVLEESSMLIIKHAKLRLWTKSQAQQDAHELLTEVFKREWQQSKKEHR